MKNLPIAVEWFQACVVLTCPQCEALADTPGVVMERKIRLNSARDGWIIVEYRCCECGFNPPALTTCLDATAKPSVQPLIVEATAEEIEAITAPPPPPKKTKIIMPARPLIPVDELLAHAEKKFPPRIKLNKSDVTLERKVVKFAKEDGEGITVTYTDGKGSFIREGEGSKPNPFHVERILFCSPDLPDNQEMVDWVLEKIGANNKWTNPNPRRAPVAAPKLNAARSRIKTGCTYPIDDYGNECGDTTGGCGHPGVLKNMAAPSGMRAATNIAVAPDGSAVKTLQHRLDPTGMFSNQ